MNDFFVSHGPIAGPHSGRQSPFAVLLFAAGFLAATAIAVAQAPQAGPFHFVGVNECVLCHSNPNLKNDWISIVVTETWSKDVHSRSHLALAAENKLTAKIEATLKIKAGENRNCVACHTKGSQEPLVPEDDEFLKREIIHNGISCETCHGAGSGYLEHHRKPEWRFKSSIEKEQLGMIDLRNPLLKAENCLSCHLGNVGQDKVVTHEMFAAGHPPLPGFEIETFGQAMPAHWRHLTEKPDTIREGARNSSHKTERGYRTDAVLMGALVAVRESAKLLKDQAANEELIWPELSLYDCAACHHDLRIPSVRQQRGYGGLVPGRPSPHAWPRELARLAIAPGTDLETLLNTMTAPLNQRPFGDRAEIAKAAGIVAASLDQEIAKFQQQSWHGQSPADWYKTHGADLLHRLCNLEHPPADLDSARQLAWLLKLAMNDGAINLDPASRARFEKLYDQQLSKPLKLTIDARDRDSDHLLDKPYWEKTLGYSRRYDPEQFAKTMKAIRALLLPNSEPTTTAEP